RKNYAPSEKVAILRRHLIDRVPISDLCDEYQLSPMLFYAWQKIFFENGAAAFERKNATPGAEHLRVIAALQAKLQRKNEVVAELMEEHVQLKGSSGFAVRKNLPLRSTLEHDCALGAGPESPVPAPQTPHPLSSFLFPLENHSGPDPSHAVPPPTSIPGHARHHLFHQTLDSGSPLDGTARLSRHEPPPHRPLARPSTQRHLRMPSVRRTRTAP